MKSACMSKKVACLVLAATILGPNIVYADELIQKDETVFVTLNKGGEVKSQIVSDWLHSDNGNIEITDKSILTNIKNTKGNEEPVKEADRLVWKSEKNDIYYQGTTDKALPIETKITYYLDGKELSGEEIVGKSGEVKIKIKLINMDKHQVKINGGTKNIYTPFTTATVVNLPQDKFTNIKLDGGEMLSDGNNQVVSFIAFPGLKESLKLDELIDDLDLNINLEDSLEISAHVENFEMGPVYITASPNLMKSEEFKKATTLDELRDGINEISDASGKLTEGALKLADGQNTFYTKMGEFNEGISKFSNSSSELKVGVNKLADGANELYSRQKEYKAKMGEFNTGVNGLATAVSPLEDGVNALATGTEVANAGANQLAAGIKQLSDGVQEYGIGATEFAKGSNDFSTNAVKVGEGAVQLTDSYEKLANGAIKAGTGTEALSNGLSKLSNGTKQLYTSSSSLAATSNGLANNLKGVSAELSTISTEGLNDEQLKKLNDCIAKMKQVEKVAQGVSYGSAELSKGVQSISGNTDALAAGAVDLNNGMKDIAEGGKGVKPYADALSEGSKQLQAGATKLNDASIQLKAGTQKIESGVKPLMDGADGLAAGLDKLVKEGTTPLKLKLPELVSGVAQIKNGSNKLYEASTLLEQGSYKLVNEGTEPLRSSIPTLMEAIDQIKDGSNKLYDGSKELANGSKELSDNMKKFDEEGIGEIDSEATSKLDDFQEVIDRKDKLVEISEEYGTFTGLANDMDGKVKFVMKTEEIKVPEVVQLKNESTEKEDNDGFFSWIKNIFNKDNKGKSN